jgi:flap endonuclease-1
VSLSFTSQIKVSKLINSEDRVRAGAAKLTKMLAAKQQGRLDGFFTVKPKEGAASSSSKGKKDDKKRKGDDKGGAGAKKKGKK